MNIELNNATENEIEYVEDEIDYTPKKFVKFRVLIILCCAVFSFFVWCYAHYLNDPILIDKMEIKWAWVENTEGANQIITDINGNVIKDMKVVFTDMEGNVIENISVYAEQSVLDKKDDFILIELNQADFVETNTKVISIDLPDDVHSHTSKIIVKLVTEAK